MKSLLLACVFLIGLSNLANATDFYISSTGNDSYTPAQASNSATPWKTIDKVNSYFASLKAGDRILFKRGETFYGTLTITKSGTASAPITISAYGTGNRPILTGFVNLSAWVSKGAGIYESYNASMGAAVNMVTINGVAQQIGRYPNINAANKGYLTFETGGSTSIVDNQLTSATSWTGADIVVRTVHWVIDRRKVTAHSGTKVTFSPALTYTVLPNFGYFFENSLKTLDQPGEWYYNPTTKKMSVFSSAAPVNVKAAVKDNVIIMSKQSYITLSELRLEGGNVETLKITGGSHNDILGCEIFFSGLTAVRATSTSYIKFDKCIINESNNDALDLRNSVSYTTVTNNTITNSGTRPGMGGSGMDTYQAILINSGTTHLVQYNTIKNTGFIPIRFNGDNVTVKNNLIDKYCYIKDDGAGIYTFNGSKENYVSRKVTGNIILNGTGAIEGTATANYYPSEGIYMDDNAVNVEITNNTVANCNKGIYVHNASGIKVQNNTFYNNTLQFSFSHDDLGDPIRNSLVTQNIMFSKMQPQMVSSIKSTIDDISQMGKFDSNYYCRPIDDRMVIFSSYKNSSGTRLEANQDLKGWQTKYSKDPKSKITPVQIPQYKLNSTVGSTKTLNGTYNTNLNSLGCTKCTAAWSSAAGLDGGHADITIPAASTQSNIGTSVGAVSSTKNYVLRFSAKGSTNIDLGMFLRQGPSPYAQLTPIQYRKVTTSRTEFEVLFTQPVSSSQTTIMIVSYTPNVKYSIDNIQLFEANATVTNIDNYIRFEYNASTANKTIPLDGVYVDVKNKSYNNSITLAPYTSAVLIKASGSAASTEAAPAPIVSLTSPTANASYTSPGSIRLTATASITDATITQVDFYNGATLIKTEKTAPYDWTWTNVAAGTYTITAKATASNGSTTTTSPVTVKVIAGSASTLDPSSEQVAVNGLTTRNFDFKLFPNPATNTIMIGYNNSSLNQKGNLVIRDMAGATIKTMPVQISGNVLQVDISFLKPGMYILSLSDKDTLFSKSFTKN